MNTAWDIVSVEPPLLSVDEEEHGLFQEVAGDIAFALYKLAPFGRAVSC